MNESEIAAEKVEGATCPKCGAPLPEEAKPLAEGVCSACGEKVTVPGKLGAYRLTRLLGRGGMGAVYEGFDESLQRKVAVKVILREKVAEDPTFLENFKREAQSAASLNHPNLVGVYAFGEYEGQPYLAMELVLPDALDRMMKGGCVAPETALRIGKQVALGLRAAAERGLVHGDVKPENILINEAREAKLADFGIAALASARAAASNEVWGTPYYIAPETLRKQRNDQRSDIYSLGATLYHAIAGVPPFEGADAVAVMKARLEKPARPLREVAPSCPEAIEKVVMRMLEAEPMKRYPNYDSLLADMDKVLATAKGSVAHGKKIVLKGKVAPAVHVSAPSAPMPTAANPNAPLFPMQHEQQGMSKGVIIGVAVAMAVLVLGILGGGAWFLVSLAGEKDKAPSAEQEATEQVAQEAVPVDPVAAQAQSDSQALAEMSEACAAKALSAKQVAEKAGAIVKKLVFQSKRAVLPDQESWLAPSEEEAPTAFLKSLQEAFAKQKALNAVATGWDDLRKKVDGLRAKCEAADAPADAPTTALAEAKAAEKAWLETPEAKDSAKNLESLERMSRHWRKRVDAARREMEASVEAKLAAEKKAKADALAEERAQRIKEAEEAEVASVATHALAVDGELDRFNPSAAETAFRARTARLKGARAKAEAERELLRFQALGQLKAWLVAEAKAGHFASYGITSANEDALTISGKSVSWQKFTSEKQNLAFRILAAHLADEAGARSIRSKERAELAVGARLFVSRYFGKDMLEKSKALRELSDKLKTIADALPGTRATLEKLEPAEAESTPSEE